MYFKRIYMHGFKSFAEPVTIEFHPGITCIVGPNGSGKSNISDAIRWVLGEQSPKMLRGGKMQEVIFAGTQNRKSRGMAEVILTIDNSTGILPIEYNEVAITRRMFRSGESEYYINGNQCRLKDIRELIMDTGIGVDGYSLIGQGKISDIVSNKTESRREIFEEAAGVVMYRSKKAEAERKLSNASGNLDRVNDIIGEIEGRIDGLREDSEKAKEFIVLRDRYRELEINITIRNVEGAEEKVKELEDEIRTITAAEEKLSEKKASVDTELSAIRTKIEALDEIIDESRDKVMVLVEEINEITNKAQLNEERLSSIEKDRKRITEELKEFESKFDTENDNIREVEKTKSKIDSKYDKAYAQLNKKTSELDEKSAEAAAALEAVDEAKNSVFAHHQKASAKRSEAGSLKTIGETLIRRKNQIAEEKTDGEAEGGLTGMDALKTAKEALEAAMNDLKGRIRDSKSSYVEKQQEERALTKKIAELGLSISQSSARKKTLEEVESSYDGYNYAVKFIMRENISGIYGTAADLMKVPSGYETAIETVLGGQIQNIICADDNTAKKAVAALKNAKAGRLTFIPLSSIKHSKSGAGLENEKGFLGYGDEVVSFDEKYRPAYEYLLSRIVVVDTMDNAIAMSKKAKMGLRFVTLEGDVVSGVGSITGGKHKNKGADILTRKADIEQLSKDISAQEKEKAEKEKSLTGIQDEMTKLYAEVQKGEEAERELERQLYEKNAEITSAEKAISALGERIRKLDSELDEIDRQMKQSEEMIKACETEALEEDRLAEEAEASIEALTAEYEARRAELDEISEEITKARIDATACDSEKQGIDALKRRIQSDIDAITESIDEREEALEELEEERLKLLGDKVSAEEADAKAEEKKRLQGVIDEAAADKAKLNEEMDNVAASQKTFDDEIKALHDQLYAADLKKARQDAVLESQKDKLWDNFEITYLEALEHKTEDFVMSKAQKENKEIRARMNEIGDVNIGAIEEYAQVSERYGFLTEQRGDILESMDDLNAIIDEMDQTIKARFKENFDNVVMNFEHVFKELFGGGSAQLVLTDPDNPLESNIDIIAQPPGKKLQNINLLSGGEKTMTAIAMMFAVLKTKPTPFCILDEVEAALDDANIERFSAYLRNFNEIQFALVTHQKATMEHADVLYGVTMPEQGVSKVLSLRLGDDFKLD